MKPEVADIAKIVDEVITEYEANHHVIFESDAERRRLHYQGVEYKLKNWKKTRQCVYSGCKAKSIRRSHTIPKSGVLQHLAEGGVVLTPEFDQENGCVQMKERGISWASTYPGFCSTHELLFANFEQRNKLETGQHLALQIYRTVSREIVRLNLQIQSGEKILELYVRRRDDRLISLMKERLTRYQIKTEVRFENFEFKEDPLTKTVTEAISKAKENLRQLRADHLTELEDALRDSHRSDLSLVVITLDAVIPVALAGLGEFHIDDHGRPKRILAILNVLPNSEETMLVIFGRHADMPYVHGYLKHWASHIMILNMIESWMIHGTDHWFLRPSVWLALPEQRRRVILDSVLDASKSIGEPSDHSVFDEMRRRLLESCEKQLETNPNDIDLRKDFERERAKLRS